MDRVHAELEAAKSKFRMDQDGTTQDLRRLWLAHKAKLRWSKQIPTCLSPLPKYQSWTFLDLIQEGNMINESG